MISANSATITITPIDDTEPESDELVIVTLAGNSNYTIVSPSSATVTIVATDPTATEAGPTTGFFTVSRTGSTAAALTVSYTVGGTATAGSDFTTPGGERDDPGGSDGGDHHHHASQ